MKSKIVKWLINKLGGLTKEQVSALKKGCGDFAIKNLQGKKGEHIIEGASLYMPFKNNNHLVLGRNIKVMDCEVKSILVAPWCENIIIRGVRVTGI